MTKQELIEKAYGDRWDDVRLDADHNGWIYYNRPQNMAYPQIGIMPQDVGFKESDVQSEMPMRGDGMYWRPEMLRGIENNNHWRIIEDDKDLPTKDGEYLACVRKNDYLGSELVYRVETWNPDLIHWWRRTVKAWKAIDPVLYGVDQKENPQ